MALPEDQSNWPIDAPAETESFNDNMLVGGYNPDASVQGKKQRKFTLSQIKAWLNLTSGIFDNTEYRNRVKSKVLWTGPLSVVSTPTSLDGGEGFDDWDLILVDVNTTSDTAIFGAQTSILIPIANIANVIYFLGDTGFIKWARIDNTSFQITQKTVTVGNISRITGISL